MQWKNVSVLLGKWRMIVTMEFKAMTDQADRDLLTIKIYQYTVQRVVNIHSLTFTMSSKIPGSNCVQRL
uniref:Odorant receptor n=1 Tax=Steinernema glaseri TaxID=37863 RepID=A0A1I7Y0V4_9BILA